MVAAAAAAAVVWPRKRTEGICAKFESSVLARRIETKEDDGAAKVWDTVTDKIW